MDSQLPGNPPERATLRTKRSVRMTKSVPRTLFAFRCGIWCGISVHCLAVSGVSRRACPACISFYCHSEALACFFR